MIKKTPLKKLDMIMDEQGELLSTKIFSDTAEHKKYAQHRLETVTEFLEDQGISQTILTDLLFTLHKNYRDKGLNKPLQRRLL